MMILNTPLVALRVTLALVDHKYVPVRLWFLENLSEILENIFVTLRCDMFLQNH